MKNRRFFVWPKTTSIKDFSRTLPRKVLAAWLMVMLLGPHLLVALAQPTLAATSPWTQTDWSGGSGQTGWSDATKFDSSSNVVTATTGEATLTNSEKLTNTGFESDTSGWTQTAENAAGTFSDSTFANTSGAIAAWPLDDTTSTQTNSRVVNPAVATGRNVVINGTFDSDTLWTHTANWTISGGVAHNDGTNVAASSMNMNPAAPLVAGRIYQATYTISNFSAGTGFKLLTGGSSSPTNRNSNGTFTEYVLAVGTNNVFIQAGIGTIGDIDNVSVVEVNIPTYNATGTQLQTDGNMEAAGTSNWTAVNSATLSKQTTNPHGGSQVLRVAYNGVANPVARTGNILTVGSAYRISGYVRSDGSASPLVRLGGNIVFSGTTTTAWQPFDAVTVATIGSIDLFSTTSTAGQYVEFDDVVVSSDNYIRSGELLQDGNMEASLSTSGTATAGGAGTLTDTNKSWTVNAFTNQIVSITSGTGSGQTRIVLSNTSNTISVSSVWSVTPDSTSQYQVIPYWSAGSGSAVTKQFTGQHGGSQSLRVAYANAGNHWALQAGMVAGKKYRITGWYRGDGGGLMTPYVAYGSSGVSIVQGTNSTTWQYFDTTAIADSSIFLLRTNLNGATSGYVEWDDVSITEINPLIGVPTNGVTLGSSTGVNGHLTNAYTFDGVNDNVNIYSSQLNSVFSPNEGTLVVWAKYTGSWTDNAGRYITAIGLSNNQIILWKHSNNSLYAETVFGGVDKFTNVATTTTNWFQIAMTWSKTSDQLKLYFNGSQAGSTITGLGTWSGNLTSTLATIGSNGTSGTNPWTGMINDVRLYNRPLTSTEISNLYNGFSAARDTGQAHTGTASMKVIADTYSNADVIQSVNVGDTNSYNLVTYAYTNGSAVTSADAELFYNGSTVSTTYTSVGSGWYKLSGTVTGANASRNYGVQVKAGKTVYLDDFSLNNYTSPGTLTSSIFDNGQGTNWGILSYNATVPTGTAVTVKARSSNSSSMVGATAFSSCAAITSGADISSNNCMTDGHRYVQYQLTLTATDTSLTPTFQDISLAFAVSDVTPPALTLTPLSPDPSTDNTPTFTGTATESVMTVSSVEFQMDSTSGTWTACTASDGTFNSATENFSCTTPTLSDGGHTIYVRSTDSNGNVSSGGSLASDSFTIDTTGPTGLSLESPGDKSYTNNERPSFRWKAASDASSGVNAYKLEIDNPSAGENQPSADFTIDSIPADRTTDYETSKYIIHYENFADADATNNYLSLTTKPSWDWGSSENDGKLREGVAHWTVKARDNAGNEATASRTLFVDRTDPAVSLTQLNDLKVTGSSFASTDRTPTLYGRITDPLAGGDTSQTQTDGGPRVASGPKEWQIKVEKQNGQLYSLVSLATISLNTPWLSCTDKEISDNSLQTCDKYLPFEYTLPNSLERGQYKITLTSKDGADNESAGAVYTLTETSLAEISTPEELAVVEEEVSTLPPAEKEVVKDKIEITKPVAPPGPTLSDRAADTAASASKKTSSFFASVGNAFSFGAHNISSAFYSIFSLMGNALASLAQSLGNTLAYLFDSAGNALAMLGNSYNGLVSQTQGGIHNGLVAIGNAFGSAGKTIGSGINQLGQNLVAFGKSIQRSANIASDTASGGAYSLARGANQSLRQLSDKTGYALLRLSYVFIQEPTTISNVVVDVLSSTSVKISWKTNTPANGKVNYGLDETYPLDIQSEEQVTDHEFVLKDLQPNTEYHFEVMSKAENYVYDANRRFKTPALSE